MNRKLPRPGSALLNYCTLPFSFGKSRRKKLLKLLKLKPRYTHGRTKLVGVPWTYPDPASFAYAYIEIFEKRIFKFDAPHETPRIIDCGANVGIASIYWKKLYPSAQITAIEADPKIYQYLLKNIEYAKCQGIETINKAVWHNTGTVLFTPESADTGGISDCMNPTQNLEKQFEIESISLESLINKQQVDLLKIDIEGAEVELLVKQSHILCYVQKVFVEYHSFTDQPQRIHELLGTLTEAGFRVHIHPEYISRRPFSTIHQDSGMDNRLNVFAWR